LHEVIEIFFGFSVHRALQLAREGLGLGSVAFAVPPPSPKPPEWQTLVKEFSDSSGTVWTRTIMVKDNSAAGTLGHHSEFQPIKVDGQSHRSFDEKHCLLLRQVQIFSNAQAVALAFNKEVWRYMKPHAYGR
jgi:hypothetical protein